MRVTRFAGNGAVQSRFQGAPISFPQKAAETDKPGNPFRLNIPHRFASMDEAVLCLDAVLNHGRKLGLAIQKYEFRDDIMSGLLLSLTYGPDTIKPRVIIFGSPDKLQTVLNLFAPGAKYRKTVRDSLKNVPPSQLYIGQYRLDLKTGTPEEYASEMREKLEKVWEPMKKRGGFSHRSSGSSPVAGRKSTGGRSSSSAGDDGGASTAATIAAASVAASCSSDGGASCAF